MHRNDIEIQIVGLQRSGNHGVIAWIAQQFDDQVVFLNNVAHFASPYEAFRHDRIPNTVAMAAVLKRGPDAITALRRSRKPALIYSYENLNLAALRGRHLVDPREMDLGESRLRRRMIILRDIYNWIASRVRLQEIKGVALPNIIANFDSLIRSWRSYAREFVGETDFLENGEGMTNVRISYNRWARDAEYRAYLLGLLGVPLSANLNFTIPDGVGGSSFDHIAVSGSPLDIRVENRWSYLLEPRFSPLIEALTHQRNDIAELNEAIFGLQWPFDGTRAYLQQGADL